MGRCASCDSILTPSEMFRTVEVEDGKSIEVIDPFCNSCLSKYVYQVDALDHHFYACSGVTDALFDTYLDINEENS